MSTQAPGQLLLFEQHMAASTRRRPQVLFDQGPGRVASLEFCVLGSGSSGNAAAVRLGGAVMLIDAGFGPRTTARRLHAAGLALDDVESVCLTHLDRDHFNPVWIRTLLARRIRLYVHSRHGTGLHRLDGASTLHAAGLLNLVNGEPFQPMGGVVVWTIPLPHDTKGTTGFLLECDSGRMGYATDLGHVSQDVVRHFAGVDLLAIESNYDPRMQQASARPAALKRRIMGGRGHLSNQQALDAVMRIMDASPRGRPSHVVLLHRSRQCNCPVLLRRLFDQAPRRAVRVTLTDQSSPTPWLTVRAITRSACSTSAAPR